MGKGSVRASRRAGVLVGYPRISAEKEKSLTKDTQDISVRELFSVLGHTHYTSISPTPRQLLGQ